MNLPKGCYFVTGIDTNIGKTYATGYLASLHYRQGRRVITQKLIETGVSGVSADICRHRAMMGIDDLPEDRLGLTTPVQLSYPASPHLASQIDGVDIDVAKLTASSHQLAKAYEIVLIEGAGGLCVPLHADGLLLVDYIKAQDYPVILLTSGRLGSINHTLLSLALLQQKQIPLTALMYNHIHDSQDTRIAQDTQAFLRAYVQKNFPQAAFWHLPVLG